jgi:threonine/homoserine/homoserine lactone efflux protein
MPDTPQLLMFIAAGWLLNLTPGPDVLFIATRALKHGVRAGLVAALGIVSGCFVHVFAAALGVGALLATSSTAFSLLKWAGVAYLSWMGLRLLLAKGAGSSLPGGAALSPEPADLWRVYRQGFLTNAINPKVALFFSPLCRSSSPPAPATNSPLSCCWGCCLPSTRCRSISATPASPAGPRAEWVLSNARCAGWTVLRA